MGTPNPDADGFPRLAQPEPPAPVEPNDERGFVAPAARARGAQVALGVFLAVLVGLLAFRGYAHRLGARPTDPAPAVALVDLNTASESELAQVPGIGSKLAEAIVDHRRRHGPFSSVDELKAVPGVGPVTYDRVRPHVRVSPITPRAENVQVTSYPPAHVQPPAPPRPAQPGARKIQPGDPPINVNTATAEELQRLPAIGPVTAQNILAARAVAPFRNLDDLDRVKGIGPKTLEKLRPFVVVK